MPRWEERRSKEGKNTLHLGVTDTNTNGLNRIFYVYINSVTILAFGYHIKLCKFVLQKLYFETGR